MSTGRAGKGVVAVPILIRGWFSVGTLGVARPAIRQNLKF